MSVRIGRRELRAALGVIGLVTVVAGIGLLLRHHPHPWWAQSGESACDTPAYVRVGGNVTTIGGCDGDFGRPVRTLSVSVGHNVDVHITQEESGDQPPEPASPLPQSSNANVVRRDTISDDGSTATYLAVTRGTATLFSDTRFCETGDAQDGPVRCPVLRLKVTG